MEEFDIDFIKPYKVMVDRFETKKNKQGEEFNTRNRCTERYATIDTAMNVFMQAKGFCMVTFRNPVKSKILAYKFK